MTWYSKQTTLTFSGKDGNSFKNELITLVKAKPLHDLNNSKALVKDLLDDSDENTAWETNNNEIDRFSSLIAVVHNLNEKLNCFEQKLEAFTMNFENSKPGNKLDEQADRHTQRLQEENDKLKKNKCSFNSTP